MPENFHLNFQQSVKAASGVYYRVVQYLGSGGNAITYLANATSGPNKGVAFAIKVFRKLSAPERRDRFLEETKTLFDIDHPAIMRVFDSGLYELDIGGQNHEHPFVVAEYLPTTLHNELRAKSLTTPQKVSVTLQLLSALVHLSERDPQIIHRDIKPQNIFIKGQSCVLGDFGLMKLVDGTDEIDRDIFKQSIGPGMPFFYRTPDLVSYAKNETDLTIKSDVFQLGLVLTELFTGKNPCVRPDDILNDVVLDSIGNIPGNNGGGIVAILKRMLVMNPDDREPISAFVDPFFGVFDTVSAQANNLEGRVI
jgi:serine/threonine protein kinase